MAGASCSADAGAVGGGNPVPNDFTDVESALGYPDVPSDELQGRLADAMGYALSAARERHAKHITDRWDRMIRQLALMNAGMARPEHRPFPGKPLLEAYKVASGQWAQLVRDTWTDPGQIPPPAGLADIVRAFGDATKNAAAALPDIGIGLGTLVLVGAGLYIITRR